jgi:hypothetical protein
MPRQVNFQVEDRVYVKLLELGQEQRLTATAYAKVLFEAAYSARWHKSGDIELEAKVGCALVLHAARRDTTEIAQALGLSESTVVRIIDAYRTERAA